MGPLAQRVIPEPNKPGTATVAVCVPAMKKYSNKCTANAAGAGVAGMRRLIDSRRGSHRSRRVVIAGACG